MSQARGLHVQRPGRPGLQGGSGAMAHGRLALLELWELTEALTEPPCLQVTMVPGPVL